MAKVYVITSPDLGWDSVVGIFDPEKVTQEELEARFNSEQYIIDERDVETNLDIWD